MKRAAKPKRPPVSMSVTVVPPAYLNKKTSSRWRRCQGPAPIETPSGVVLGVPCPWGWGGVPALTLGRQCPRCARGVGRAG